MKLRVSVLMGGPSAEHDVSLRTGRQILTQLDRKKYSVRAVVISPGRQFFAFDATERVPSENDLSAPAQSDVFDAPVEAAESLPIWQNTDIALLALHGSFGEDGVIQGFLETAGVPYTGSGIFSSAVGMDKIASKRLFEAAGLVTPRSTVLRAGDPPAAIDACAAKHGFPCFVKCPQSGSSRLMGRAVDRQEMDTLTRELFRHSPDLLVETDVSGDEYSCPVLEYPDGTLRALPPVYIQPVSASFFDYSAKYDDGGSREIVPAPCPEELQERLRHAALCAHSTLRCSGLTRTDMILSAGTLYVLEINTLPGLTPASLAPKSFAAAGGTYPELLDILIQTALKRR